MTCNLIDTTISFNKNTEFRNSFNSLVSQLEKSTNFNDIEVTTVLMIFCKFYKSFKKKFIDVRKLHAWFGLIGIVNESIVSQILKFLKFDACKQYIDPRDWVNLLNIFTGNNLMEQIKYVFQIYDVEEMGYINLQNVVEHVRLFFRTDDEEENEELTTDMSELIFKKFDLNKDGIIAFEEYTRAVLAEPLLLECLGRCLPSRGSKLALLYSMNLMKTIMRAEQVKAVGDLSRSQLMKIKTKSEKTSNVNDSNAALVTSSYVTPQIASKQAMQPPPPP